MENPHIFEVYPKIINSVFNTILEFRVTHDIKIYDCCTEKL